MAAIQGTRVSTSVVTVFAAGISAALIVGAVGGYAVRGLRSTGAAVTQSGPVHAAPGTVLGQDKDNAVSPVELPDWVQRYIAPVQESRFNVDQYIRDLQAGQVHAAPGTVLGQDNMVSRPVELPDWVQKYITTAPEQGFDIDQYIRDLQAGQVHAAPGTVLRQDKGNLATLVPDTARYDGWDPARQ